MRHMCTAPEQVQFTLITEETVTQKKRPKSLKGFECGFVSNKSLRYGHCKSFKISNQWSKHTLLHRLGEVHHERRDPPQTPGHHGQLGLPRGGGHLWSDKMSFTPDRSGKHCEGMHMRHETRAAYLAFKLPEVRSVEFVRVGHHFAGMNFPQNSQELIYVPKHWGSKPKEDFYEGMLAHMPNALCSLNL